VLRQIITSLPWLPPGGVAPENADNQSETGTDSRRDSDNNNTRVMWMRGAARIQKQVCRDTAPCSVLFTRLCAHYFTKFM